MNQILERVELEYWSKKPYSFEIKITENNIENPNFLRNLNKSSYFAYLNNVRADFSVSAKAISVSIHAPVWGAT